jgi:hypothetical protein
MRNFTSYGLIIFGFFTACSITEIDWPSAPEGVYWKHQGYTFRMAEQVMAKCGYPVRVGRNDVTRENYLQSTEAYEKCMLDNGFIFSKTGWPDIDPGFQYRKSDRCVLEERQAMPACQSLIKSTEAVERQSPTSPERIDINNR